MSFLTRIAARALDSGVGNLLMPKGSAGAFRAAAPEEEMAAPQPSRDSPDGTISPARASRSAVHRALLSRAADAADAGDQPLADDEGNEVRPLRRGMAPAADAPVVEAQPNDQPASRAARPDDGEAEEPAPQVERAFAHRLAPAGEEPIKEPERYPEETAQARVPSGVMAKRVARSASALPAAGAPPSAASPVAGPGSEPGDFAGEFDAWRPDFGGDDAATDEGIGDGATASDAAGFGDPRLEAPSPSESSAQWPVLDNTVIEQIDVFVSEPAPVAPQRPRLSDPAALLAARYLGTL